MGGSFLGQAAFEYQQAKRQGQCERCANTCRLPDGGSGQAQVPELQDADQRQQRPAAQPQHRCANLRQQAVAEPVDQALMPGCGLDGLFDRFAARHFQRLGTPIGHPPGRLQAGHQQQQGRRAVDQYHRPDRHGCKQRYEQRQYPTTEGQGCQADTGLAQSTGVEQPLLKTREAFNRSPVSL